MQTKTCEAAWLLILRRLVCNGAVILRLSAFITLTLSSSAHAQNLLWAKRAGGTAIDQAQAIAVDGVGNSYVTGRFGTTATFGPGEANQTLLTSSGQDVFIAKYNSSGQLQWVRQASSLVAVGTGIAVDSLGNSYVAGTFSNTLTFAPGTVNQLVLTSVGSNDIFVAKYDANGTLLWARRDGGTSGDTAQSLALDALGNSYVTGTYAGTATFGLGEANETTIPGTITGTPCNGVFFVAKYNSNGVFQWVKRGTNSRSTGIAADGAGNNWAVGDFCGAATFNPGDVGETTLTAATATRDIFVTKYGSNGAVLWAKRIDTTLGSSLDAHVATDGLGNSYVTGLFRGSATFGPGEGGETTLTSDGNEDIFVAKYDPNGVLQWAKRAGGTGIDWGTGIAADIFGNSYVTGYFRDAPATFGLGEVNETTLTSAGNEDIFVAKFATNGLLQWARRAGGGSDDRGFGIALDGIGNSHVAGRFAGTATFGPGEANQTILTSANNFDVFVAKFASGPIIVDCSTDSLQSAVNLAAPGSTILVSGTCNENILVRNEKQRITIDGAGAGAGTQATINGAGGSPTVNVRGKGILIQNFIITGGSHGVQINRGSNAVLSNNAIHNTGGDGVQVDQLSFAVLTGNTIENNVRDGVSVEENSTARIGFNLDSESSASANTIQNNAGRGVTVDNGSSARIVGNTLSGNGQEGVVVERDSSADVANNAIDGNQSDGIKVEKNSLVMLGEDSGTTIYDLSNSTSVNNTGFGISCDDGSAAGGRLGTLTGNGGATNIDSSCVSALNP